MWAAALIVHSCAGSPLLAAEQTYDLVNNNGRVMDPETLYDDIANVGVKDGRIRYPKTSTIHLEPRGQEMNYADRISAQVAQ